jgi:hypothetical protein
MSRRSFADRVLPRLAAGSLVVAAIAIVGLISEVVGVVQQLPVQHGIDRHTVQLIGTYSDRIAGGGLYADDTYLVTYPYEGQVWTTKLRGLPGSPKIGDQFCVEIDATKPEHGRVCGTRGGLGDAESGLVWGGSIIAACVAFLLFMRWWIVRRLHRA